MTNEKSVQIEKLSVAINKHKIINELDLDLQPQTITCILAPNGMGKTTLFRAISNTIPIQSGKIKVNSFDSKERQNFNKNIFFIEKHEQLFQNFTATENMKMITKLWGKDCQISQISERVGISDYQNKKINKMSLGMKQKVLLATSIASGADVLIYDEILNGLDIQNVAHVSQVLIEMKQQGKTILLSSHNIFEIRKICDTIYFLINGKLMKAPLDYEELIYAYQQCYYKGADLNA
ncbi:ATP-binding cassette domain-containing protein [Vagococcus silagei]|uniref:ABC transporter ATP-binding protein n=1 Tax=Vagococcus silagei TaxID=2508885 RepID=A0A4S3B7Y9_9ENTE|nr:ABC transporter ATP-binding protein [Vagococcus silagei]THB60935.1 ABC transporter ATP-binding protein [Vagococcus silagei]